MKTIIESTLKSCGKCRKHNQLIVSIEANLCGVVLGSTYLLMSPSKILANVLVKCYKSVYLSFVIFVAILFHFGL